MNMKDSMKKFLAKIKGDSYYEPDQLDEARDANEHKKVGNPHWEFVVDKFNTRRSIRKFSQNPVEWKIVYDIISAALNNPCAGNIQNSKVIVVKERNIIENLARAESQQYWIADAPVVLVVVRENSRLEQLYPDEGRTCAIQNSAA